MSVAQTILAQLGGNQFIVMTGAKNFVGGERDLSFKIGKNCKKVSHVKITLNGMDLYNVQYLNIRGVKVTVVAEEFDLYNNQLQQSFTTNTGMDTHLYIRVRR
jgi:uncharacterized membrane protein (Fun14 family)